ncbi:7517_t:CDS:1, partial [Funneliformis geosporum]
VKLQITEYLRAYKFKLNVADFVKFIEDEIIPALRIEKKTSISHSTAREWLHILGRQYKDHSKNIYFDGHEREDVVANRSQFLQ